jgi:2-polyprenyl-3-methyl-5-hydroxy-6-metoxy-1,4-benzoquinol methylase
MVEGENGATEQKDLATVLGRREEVEAYVTRLIARLRTHLGGLQKGGRILDVGAAQGLHVSVLRSSGYDAHGVEPWPEAVELADAVARSLGVDPAVVVREGEALPFESGTFDLVIMVSVLEHVADPDRTLAEANRVLRPGGGLAATGDPPFPLHFLVSGLGQEADHDLGSRQAPRADRVHVNARHELVHAALARPCIATSWVR